MLGVDDKKATDARSFGGNPRHEHLDPNDPVGMAQGLMTILGIAGVGPVTAKHNPQTDQALDAYAKAHGMTDASDMNAVLASLKKDAHDLISQPGKLKELNDQAVSGDKNGIRAFQYMLSSQGGNFSKYGVDGFVGRDETERAYGDVQNRLDAEAAAAEPVAAAPVADDPAPYEDQGPDRSDMTPPVDNTPQPVAPAPVEAASAPVAAAPAVESAPPAAAAPVAAAPVTAAPATPYQVGGPSAITASYNLYAGIAPPPPRIYVYERPRVEFRAGPPPCREHFGFAAHGYGYAPRQQPHFGINFQAPGIHIRFGR